MKKFIIFSVIALVALFAVSCNKENALPTSTESSVKTSDDYNEATWKEGEVVTENAPEVEEINDDDTYNGEAVVKTKILSVSSRSGQNGDQMLVDCAGNTNFKYKNYAILEKYYLASTNWLPQNEFVVKFSRQDTIVSVTANSAIVRTLVYEGDYEVPNGVDIDSTIHIFYMDRVPSLSIDAYTAKTVKLTFVLKSGITISKSVKTIEKEYDWVYGTSGWIIYITRRSLGLTSNIDNYTYTAGTQITSAYVPTIGDVIQYSGVSVNQDQYIGGIITASTLTNGIYKIKITEMNANCNTKKTTKSISWNPAASPLVGIPSANPSTALSFKYRR
ncbi:MAG: hypothetical protein RLZZ292_2999 [Bacteroidota bacterium]|jgi:hypothetical protein